MNYNAWFQCINGCPGQFSLLEVIYRCPSCGDLLEVRHDIDALKTKAAAAWIKLFDDRCRRGPCFKGIDVVADRKSTRLNSSHVSISYAVFCLKKKIKQAYAPHNVADSH